MSKRSRWIALAVASSIVLLAGGFVYLRGGSTAVSLDSAVERFRERSETVAALEEDRPVERATEATESERSVQVDVPITSSVAPSDGLRPLPREGVYVYATTGGDEVDVLGGSRHSYPPETTITVRHKGCGVVEHWDALEERWDERESCRTAEGETLERVTSFHEFFGHADQRTLRCTGFTYPAGFQPGASWTTRCSSENTTAVTTMTAVAWENVDVGGVSVRAMHVRAQTKLTGEQEGTSEREVWGATDSGVVVQERTTLTSYSNQPVFGRTRYHESYELRLTSLEPRR